MVPTAENSPGRPQGVNSSTNGCCLFRFPHGAIFVPLFPKPSIGIYIVGIYLRVVQLMIEQYHIDVVKRKLLIVGKTC